MRDYFSSWFNSNLLTTLAEKLGRLKTDSAPSSFDENRQFRFFEDLSIPDFGAVGGAGSGVPASSQLVYRIASTYEMQVFLRQINVWQGGRKYLVYPADGNETYDNSSEVDVSDQIYPTNGILRDGLTQHPESGVTITRAFGQNIFSTTSKPRNGTAALTDGNSNRASSSYTANGDRGGVGAGQSFYLVFDHIGSNNATLALYLIAFEVIFPEQQN